VRVEEKVSTKRWYEVASGGREGEVTPRRFISTFCACTAGLVALCRDLLAKRSLLLMATGVAGGTRTFLLGGVDTSTVGDGSLHRGRKVGDDLFNWGADCRHPQKIEVGEAPKNPATE